MPTTFASSTAGGCEVVPNSQVPLEHHEGKQVGEVHGTLSGSKMPQEAIPGTGSGPGGVVKEVTDSGQYDGCKVSLGLQDAVWRTVGKGEVFDSVPGDGHCKMAVLDNKVEVLGENDCLQINDKDSEGKVVVQPEAKMAVQGMQLKGYEGKMVMQVETGEEETANRRDVSPEELGINLVKKGDTLLGGKSHSGLGELEGEVECMSIQEEHAENRAINNGEQVEQDAVCAQSVLETLHGQHQVSAHDCQDTTDARRARPLNPLKLDSIPYTATTAGSSQPPHTPIRPSVQEGTLPQKDLEQYGEDIFSRIVKKIEELLGDPEKINPVARKWLYLLKKKADAVSRCLNREFDELFLREIQRLDDIVIIVSENLELTEGDRLWLSQTDDEPTRNDKVEEYQADQPDHGASKHKYSASSLYSEGNAECPIMPPSKQSKLFSSDYVRHSTLQDRNITKGIGYQATDDGHSQKFIQFGGVHPWQDPCKVWSEPRIPKESLEQGKVVYATEYGLLKFVHELHPCHVSTYTTGGIVSERLAQEIDDRFDDGVHFTVLRELGHGSYGSVSLCQTIGKNYGEVFVKKQVHNKAKFRASEVMVPLQILHKHIPRVFGFIETPQDYVILQEYAGINLTNFLRSFEMEDHHIEDVTHQLLDAVAYLHSFQIFHRDIKADNIGIEPIGDVYPFIKLLDYGACITPQDSPDLMGLTTAHCSPELCDVLVRVYIHKQACEDLMRYLNWERADAYAIGCTILHMYKGAHIWYERMKGTEERGENSSKELLTFVAENPKACLREIPEDCVGDMRGLVEDLMTSVECRTTPTKALRHRALAQFGKSARDNAQNGYNPSRALFTPSHTRSSDVHHKQQMSNGEDQGASAEKCEEEEEGGGIPDFGVLLSDTSSVRDMQEDDGDSYMDTDSSDDSDSDNGESESESGE